MHSCLCLYPICKNMLELTFRVTWSKRWQWPSGWRHTKVEMGPEPVEPKGQRNLKSKTNKVMWRRCRGIHLEALFWLSKANRSKIRDGDVRAISRRENKNVKEGSSKANATIVAEIMQCGTARSGKISRRNSNPRETDYPTPFAHTDGPLGLC